MTQFDDRERAFENRFALDQEQAFKALARRNRKAAEWAAGLLGITDVESFVKEVVKSDLEVPGDSDVVAKLKADFDAKNVAMDEATIQAKLDVFAAEAAAEIKAG